MPRYTTSNDCIMCGELIYNRLPNARHCIKCAKMFDYIKRYVLRTLDDNYVKKK